MRKRMKSFRFAGGTLQSPVHAERVLGAHIPFSAKQVGGAHWDRLELAVERARRIRWLPLAFHQREQSRDGFEEGRFSGAVSTEQGNDFSFRNG